MIDSFTQDFFKKIFVSPVVKLLPERVTPNQLTLLAGCFGILVIPLLYFRFSIIACIFIIISGYLDNLDGALASTRRQITNTGALFDLTMDRLVEFSVILGLYLYNPDPRGFLCILMLGSMLICITTFLGTGIFSENDSEKSFKYSRGIIERTETFILFILLILLPEYFVILSLLYTVLILITACLRIKNFIKNEKVRVSENNSEEIL
ncbi:MAG: CDP-alcohol phosphatidyltransferase family protein [bacterium]|nr:CDP-alcohol phosphatidyltransferase family protein [bacterium]